MDQAQLNSYALIAEHLGLGQVSKLTLIYVSGAGGPLESYADMQNRPQIPEQAPDTEPAADIKI